MAKILISDFNISVRAKDGFLDDYHVEVLLEEEKVLRMADRIANSKSKKAVAGPITMILKSKNAAQKVVRG